MQKPPQMGGLRCSVWPVQAGGVNFSRIIFAAHHQWDLRCRFPPLQRVGRSVPCSFPHLKRFRAASHRDEPASRPAPGAASIYDQRAALLATVLYDLAGLDGDAGAAAALWTHQGAFRTRMLSDPHQHLLAR